MSSVDLEDLGDQHDEKDFRRANGAPMVKDLDGKKWLRYSRPSGWGDDLDDESALTLWKIDRAMDGVAQRPSIAAKLCAIIGTDKPGRKELRQQAIEAGKGIEAADLGTALHAIAERYEREPYPVPEPFDADIAAYLSALDTAGLTSEYIEVHVCADAWRAAGTADRIYRTTKELVTPDGDVIPPGSLIIGDLKTGKMKDYTVPGYTIQMAIYSDGCLYDVVEQTRSPMPDGLRADWGILIHLPAGQGECTLHWCDLRVGREGAKIVQAVRAWRKRKDFIGEFVMPASDESALMSTYTEPDEPPVPVDFGDSWYEPMLVFAQQRINAIGQHSEARGLLLRKWPPDVAPFRQQHPTEAELSRILDLLDDVEAAFSMPFPDGDPRAEWDRGKHRSEMERGNQPRHISAKEQRKQ